MKYFKRGGVIQRTGCPAAIHEIKTGRDDWNIDDYINYLDGYEPVVFGWVGEDEEAHRI